MEHSAEDTAGLAPATAVYTGDATTPFAMRLLEFDTQQLTERTVEAVGHAKSAKSTSQLSWIDVTGLADTEKMTALADVFQIHPLALEDVLNTSTRAKAEEFDDQLLVTANMVRLRFEDGEPILSFEHASILATKGVVLTFQERPGDAWDPVRRRIRSGMSRIRSGRSSYLAYCLLDAIVDDYTVVIEQLGREAERMEAMLLDDPESVSIPQIYVLRRELTELRRKAWPFRDLLAQWKRSETLSGDAAPFLNDLQEHATQVVESIDLYREMVIGMVDLHMSGVNNKMNQTMHTLTVIATLFIPLTFLTGLYGMNFDHMPELHTEFGYPIALGSMAITFFGGLGWFKWRGML